MTLKIGGYDVQKSGLTNHLCEEQEGGNRENPSLDPFLEDVRGVG